MASYAKTKRNLALQLVPLFGTNSVTGEKVPLNINKKVFHLKKFHQVQYADLSKIWHDWNRSPIPKSKRQTLLRKETVDRIKDGGYPKFMTMEDHLKEKAVKAKLLILNQAKKAA